MGKSLRIHNNYKCIGLAVVGLLLLVAAIFMHDIGFIGEHGHEEHGHEENGQDDHGHEEHGGIGETLETIFTVIGGLILLSAHYLNIRLSNKSA